MPPPPRRPTPPASHGLFRRHFVLGAASLALAACAPPPALRQRSALSLVGEVTLPHRLAFGGTTVGGLSAIDHDPASGLFDLLSDDRSDLQPARFYRARIPMTAAGVAPPEFVEVVTLRQGDAQDRRPWPGRRQAVPGVPVPDPESLRRLPGGQLLWTSEGDAARGFAPAVHVARADGTLLRQFTLPGCFAVGTGHGVRDNLAFEGLTIDDGGTRAWVAMENALQQDGAVPTVASPGGPCRFTQFDIAGGTALRQIAYTPDAIPSAPLIPGTYADNGVSEVLLQDAHRLLVLERAYMAGRGNSLRLYRIDTRQGSDTLALDALTPGNHRPCAKELVADFGAIGLRSLQNTEGLCWGPRLPDGRRTLWAVSDDNFNPAQSTQIAVFAITD